LPAESRRRSARSRRLDHAASPSAACVSSDGATRLTPAASIAPHAQRFVTIATRPSGGLRVEADHFRFAELSRNSLIRRSGGAQRAGAAGPKDPIPRDRRRIFGFDAADRAGSRSPVKRQAHLPLAPGLN